MIGSQVLKNNAGIAENDWIDSRAIASFSLTAAAAGFLFSFRAILVMITARWLRIGTETGVAASLIAELVLLMVVTFQSIGPASRSLRSLTRPASVRWVLVFLGFSCSSLLWSATVSRSASFMYWSATAADVAIVLLLLRTRPANVITHSLMRGFIAGACLLAAIAWIMPTQEDLRLGDQDYFNTNQIGNLCAIAIFMEQFLLRRKDGKRRAATIFLTVTLLRTLSKATIIAFLLAEGFLLVYDKTMSRKKKALVIAGATLLLLAFGGLIESYFDAYTTTGNQAATLTGRTGIWAYTLEESLQKPWTGNGMDAMWKVFPPFGRDQFEARHAENELLQQFFAYGLAGLVMLIGLYGSLYQRIRRLPQGRAKAILAGIMLYVVVRGFAEAEPFDLLLPLWMITLIACSIDAAALSLKPAVRKAPASTVFELLPSPGSAPR